MQFWEKVAAKVNRRVLAGKIKKYKAYRRQLNVMNVEKRDEPARHALEKALDGTLDELQKAAAAKG